MGIKLTEKEQLMLSKTLPVSSEYLTYHHGTQGDEVLTSGWELSSALRNLIRKMQFKHNMFLLLVF